MTEHHQQARGHMWFKKKQTKKRSARCGSCSRQLPVLSEKQNTHLLKVYQQFICGHAKQRAVCGHAQDLGPHWLETGPWIAHIPWQRASKISPLCFWKRTWDCYLLRCLTFLTTLDRKQPDWGEDRNSRSRNESGVSHQESCSGPRRMRWLWVSPKHVFSMCPSTAYWKRSCSHSFWQSETLQTLLQTRNKLIPVS